jgi:serine/threonine-protein kinase RsbW
MPVTAPNEVTHNAANPDDSLLAVFPATGSAIAGVRRQVDAWLRQLGWPAEGAQDIVLAVYEALANVVDHAYSSDHGPAQRQGRLYVWHALDGSSGERHVVATVTDHGRWKPPPDALADGEPSLRGRGLLMMRACMAQVDLLPGAEGTTVILTSRSAEAAAC